jgi:hypothetical protein
MDRADQRDVFLFRTNHSTDAYRVRGADVDNIGFEFLNDFFHIQKRKGSKMVLIVHVKWQNERAWSVDGRPVLLLDCVFKGESRGDHPDIMAFLDEFMDDTVLRDRTTINNRVI